MKIRKPTAAIAAAGVLALAGPVASAAAASAQPTGQSQIPGAALTFVPPSVGPICVTLGPTIIGGQMTSPGLHVCTSGTTLQPLQFTALPLP
jgi:hypothetical protein